MIQPKIAWLFVVVLSRSDLLDHIHLQLDFFLAFSSSALLVVGVSLIELTCADIRGVYTMDLKNGNGSIKKGDSGGTADCTVTVSEQVSPSLSFPHGPTDATFPPCETTRILIGTGMPCCRILSTWYGARRTARSCS
jgi:hypothetical protein